MRTTLAIAALLLGPCATLVPTTFAQAAGEGPSVAVNYAQPGLLAPELIPITVELTKADTCKKMDGRVVVSVMVDEQGQPHDPTLLVPLGDGLDLLALHLATLDRFKPGTLKGNPAPVAVVIAMKLKACYLPVQSPDGKPRDVIRLRAPLEQKASVQPAPPEAELRRILARPAYMEEVENLGKGADLPPTILKAFDPEYSDQGRKNLINGICLISLVVDAQGLPHELRLVRRIEPGMDANAIAAVSHYRFRPALRNGHPIPVRLTIEVTFRISAGN